MLFMLSVQLTNRSYISSLSVANLTIVNEPLECRALDSHVNYYSGNRRSWATKRKICPTSVRRRSRETIRRLRRSANGCVQLRETTKRDRLKESPTPCILSLGSLELTRNYAITFTIRMPWSGLAASAYTYVCRTSARMQQGRFSSLNFMQLLLIRYIKKSYSKIVLGNYF